MNIRIVCPIYGVTTGSTDPTAPVYPRICHDCITKDTGPIFQQSTKGDWD